MKNLLLTTVLLFATQSFAGPNEGTGDTGSAGDSQAFYECSEIAGVEEYRVGINLKNGLAAFFDNDSTSTLRIKGVSVLEGIAPAPGQTFRTQIERTYEGKFVNSQGRLRLIFNQGLDTVSLYQINKVRRKANRNARATETESVVLIGNASCAQAEAWDEIK